MSTMTRKTTATLLDVDESILTKKLLLEDDLLPVEKELTQLLPDPSPHATVITPQPGVVVKARTQSDSSSNSQQQQDGGICKVFLNLCTSDQVPAPDDITSQELLQILESDDPSNFRIPMSIGPPHQEKDKSGEACTAYDIIVNPSFLDKSKNDPLFHNFFVMATMESLEQKYDLHLDKQNWSTLKNKLYYGTAAVQAVRTAMPLVMELGSGRGSTVRQAPAGITEVKSSSQHNSLRVLNDEGSSSNKSSNKEQKHARLLSTVTSKALSAGVSKRRPECVVRRVMPPAEGSSKGVATDGTQHQMIGVTACVKLPGLSSGADVAVLVGEDRLVLESSLHYLDLLLPCMLLPDAATAHFAADTQSMVISAPVQCS